MRLQARKIVREMMGERAHRAAREDRDGEAELFERSGVLQRGLAAFHHVGKERYAAAKARADRGELIGRLRRLDEQHVRSGGEIGIGAIERRIEALDRDRIGSRDQQHLVVRPCVERGPDLSAHLSAGNEFLAGEMAAALRRRLVLELQGGRAGLCEELHRPLHVQGIAKTGIHVDDQRDGDTLADRGDGIGKFAEGDGADIGPSQPRIGDGRAGDIGGLETRPLGQQRRQRVVAAGSDHQAGHSETGAQTDHV